MKKYHDEEDSKDLSVTHDEKWITSKYESDLKKIRESVEKLYEENKNEDLPFFTPHGVEHCRAVEDLIQKLIIHKKPNEPSSILSLSEKERFCLSACAWLHDIGMLPSVFRTIYPTEQKTASIIREKHHITSSKFIVEYYSRCGVDEKDKELLSLICHFHRRRENISNCHEEFIIGLSDPKSIIRTRLLASYLRLADSLHVDISRVPSKEYALCLTYSIPPDNKLHWIRSQIVNGIAINCEDHEITVSFKTQHYDDSGTEKLSKEFYTKLDSIIKLVLSDLREELASVTNVLLKYGISYFLNIKGIETTVYMTNQMKNDLNELVLNYDIMEHPSASRLLVMIISTIINLAGYSKKSNSTPDHVEFERFKSDYELNFSEVKNAVHEKFLTKLLEDFKNTRPCHKGIKKLIDWCNEINKYSETIEDYAARFIRLFNSYTDAETTIKKNAYAFFNEVVSTGIPPNTKDKKYKILIFGYSQSVVNALMGFKKALKDNFLKNKFKENETAVFEKEINVNASDYFRFFICEGSAKTKMSPDNRILYHDGSQYALALEKAGFNDLVIFPDITLWNIIEKNGIDLVMVGANGFDKDNFIHSAGHNTVFKLVKSYNTSREKETSESKHPSAIKTLLVVSSNKMDENEPSAPSQGDKPVQDEPSDREGSYFWKGEQGEITRENIWIPRDKSVLKELYEKKIMFFNPREDIIPISDLDYIICDTANTKDPEQTKDYFQIKTEDDIETKANKDKFIEVMKEHIKHEWEDTLRAKSTKRTKASKKSTGNSDC